MIRLAIAGCGYWGPNFIRNFSRLAHCELRAVCDLKPERLVEMKRLYPGVGTVSDFGDLLRDPQIDAVAICTPLNTHFALAQAALSAGKHVLVEKPVALHSADVERLASAAAASATLCMPAHCMRFWPGWVWLKEQITAGTYGAVRSAVFRRLASPPAWSADFYANSERTGGALIDLHIHDADFVRWCFGEPDAVQSAGDLDHITTLYRYAEGPRHVVAEGGWDHTPGFPFQMRYVVVFEEATADFDLGRDPQLVVSASGESRPVELPAGDGYLGEVSHLIDAIRSGSTALRCTIEEAAALAHMLEREREQLT